jgi:hypothetical protein
MAQALAIARLCAAAFSRNESKNLLARGLILRQSRKLP